MNENTPGVIAQARATAPVAAGQQPAQPVAQPQQTPQPQQAAPAPEPGFNAPPPQSGFAQPQVQQPAAPVIADPAIPVDNTRTQEQFSKLTESNQRLSQQTQTLAQQNESLRQELQRLQTTQQPQQQQVTPVPNVPQVQQPSALPKLEDYIEIDPRTGDRFVNEAKFNAAVADMADIYQKASRAEQVVQNYVQTAQQREIDRDLREAFTKYPQLNPQGGQLDRNFAQQSRAIALDSMMNPNDYGGKVLSYREAADYIANSGTAGQQRAATSAVPTPTVNEANQVQKEQAAASAQSTPQQVASSVDAENEYQRQVMGTRMGSDEAIAVRLLNATHRLQDVEAEAAQPQAR